MEEKEVIRSLMTMYQDSMRMRWTSWWGGWGSTSTEPRTCSSFTKENNGRWVFFRNEVLINEFIIFRRKMQNSRRNKTGGRKKREREWLRRTNKGGWKRWRRSKGWKRSVNLRRMTISDECWRRCLSVPSVAPWCRPPAPSINVQMDTLCVSSAETRASSR